MKFIRKDTPTIMSGKVVRYQADEQNEISASRNYVSVRVDGIMHQEELDAVIEYLKRAFRQYVQLKSSYNNEPFPEEAFDLK